MNTDLRTTHPQMNAQGFYGSTSTLFYYDLANGIGPTDYHNPAQALRPPQGTFSDITQCAGRAVFKAGLFTGSRLGGHVGHTPLAAVVQPGSNIPQGDE